MRAKTTYTMAGTPENKQYSYSSSRLPSHTQRCAVDRRRVAIRRRIVGGDLQTHVQVVGDGHHVRALGTTTTPIVEASAISAGAHAAICLCSVVRGERLSKWRWLPVQRTSKGLRTSSASC